MKAPWGQRWSSFYLRNSSVSYKMLNKYFLKEWVRLIILSLGIFENLIFKNSKLQAITGCVFLFCGKLDRILALPCCCPVHQDCRTRFLKDCQPGTKAHTSTTEPPKSEILATSNLAELQIRKTSFTNCTERLITRVHSEGRPVSGRE